VQRRADGSPAMAGFTVPKKKFKKSVQRHRIIRLMREAWRLHKHQLYIAIPPDKQIHIFMLYTSTDLADYKTIEESVQRAIGGLQEIVQKTTA